MTSFPRQGGTITSYLTKLWILESQNNNKACCSFLLGKFRILLVDAFHPRTHLDLRICSGLSFFQRIGFKALVWIQQFSSAFFAFSNNNFSWMFKFLMQTSARARLPTFAGQAISSGLSAAAHQWTSFSFKSMDKAKHCWSSHSRGRSIMGSPSSASRTSCVDSPGDS